MADVQTTPEVETIPVTKTVDGKVEETATVEETTVTSNGHTNGEANGDASIEDDDHAKTNGTNGATNGETNGDGHDAAAVNGDTEAEVAADESAAVVAESADAVAAEEEPVEEAPPKIKLFQFPVGKEIPSTSPFCLKVETFLRINGIPYENVWGYKMGKKGKLPWIEYNGERIVDSKFIFKYVKDKFEVNMDSELTEEQVAVGRAVSSMLEENTYWALIYNRYVDNFNEYKKFMAQGQGGIGFNVSQKMFQRKMRSNLEGHGMGRHIKTEVYEIAQDDLCALSKILGEKEFLLGDKISSFDCAAFGLCANILYSGMDNPMKTCIQENFQNVNNWCDKIKETYWADWEEIIESGKVAEPALKKGFSFRKKKTPKAPKPDAAAEGSDEATSSDEPAAEAVSEEKPAEESAAAEETTTEEKAEDATAPTEETPVAETPAESTTETSETTEVKETTNETTTEPVTQTSETTPEA